MKTTIQGYEPNTTTTGEISIETVYSQTQAGLIPLNGDSLVDVRVGDKAVRISLRELTAAVLGAEKAAPPPGWTLQGLYGPNGTTIPPAPWGVRQW